MDKLRALQYFLAAADEGSLSGAARRLDVSLPAVAKLVAGLERELGVALFDRTARGLKLTASGESYLESCRPALDQLSAADSSVGRAAHRPHGTLVIGAPPQLAQHCLLPELARFHTLYPDVRIDLRAVNHVTDTAGGAVDVFVLLGWPRRTDLVMRHLALTRLLTCAAPGYWAKNGVPQRPRDLERHVCMPFRNPEGTLIDLWQYERGGETESVTVRGWLTSDHRDLILQAVLAGEGVARVVDLTVGPYLASGQLVPVLLEWAMKDAPPISLLYRPNQRRDPRVRAFSEFVSGLFRELDARRSGDAVSQRHAEIPYWYGRRGGRASTARRRA